MFLATAAAAWYAARTLGAINREITETKKAAEAAEASAEHAASALATQREIERAYITIDCTDVRFLLDPDNPETLKVRRVSVADTIEAILVIKNVGRTPGNVIGGWCGFLYQQADVSAPELRPSIDSSVTFAPLFLLPSDSKDFVLRQRLNEREVYFLRYGEPVHSHGPLEDAPFPVKDPNKAIWLAGEIDYCDRFGGRHRAGYATRWERSANRFLWDPSVSRLNYDRPMSENERKRYV